MPELRILIVDDSVIYRKLLSQAVAAEAGGASVEIAANGLIALTKMSMFRADLVFLDVFMPEMNGPEVLQKLRQNYPETSVVMVSGATDADADITMNALAMGALDFIPKPRGDSFNDGMEKLRAQIRQVLQLVKIRSRGKFGGGSSFSSSPAAREVPARPAVRPASVPVFSPKATTQKLPSFAPTRSHSVAPVAAGAPSIFSKRPPGNPEIVLLGVSTGGPRALQDVIPLLPKNFPVPVVLVQHMPPVFTKSLADQLDKNSHLKVVEAGDGEAVVAGKVYIAPGGSHLEIFRTAAGGFQTKLTSDPPVNSCRPAVDVLFRSAAACRLRGAIAVILTGMGEDGTAGVNDLKNAGTTWCLAQDAATCVVYGMPMMVAQKGLADEVLPLGGIAPRLCSLLSVR